MRDQAEDDLTLLRATAAGDRAAFSALVARWRGPIFRYARSLVASESAAEDVLQETFLAVFRGAPAFSGDAFRPWLFGIARRLAARTWRHHVGEDTDPVPLHELGEAAGWGAQDDPEAAASALEDHARLVAGIASLSPADQEILTLRDLEGLTGPEVAALLGATEAALKTRLHRARLRLLAALRPPTDARVTHG